MVGYGYTTSSCRSMGACIRTQSSGSVNCLIPVHCSGTSWDFSTCLDHHRIHHLQFLYSHRREVLIGPLHSTFPTQQSSNTCRTRKEEQLFHIYCRTTTVEISGQIQDQGTVLISSNCFRSLSLCNPGVLECSRPLLSGTWNVTSNP